MVLSYEDPARRSEIEPIRVSLPADEQRMVDLRSVPGLEPGEPFMVRVESLGFDGAAAIPVVAEMVVDNGVLVADAGGGTTAEEAPPDDPTPVTGELVDGLTVVSGSPVMAPTWLLATSAVSDQRASTIVVANLGDEVVRVSVEVVSNGSRSAGSAEVQVPAGDRRVLDLGEPDPTALYVVTGTAPVVVSRTVVSTEGNGISTSLGAPLPIGVRTLPAAS